MNHQSFWFGFDLDNLLFHNLNIHSVQGFIWLCIGLFILTVIFEGLKVVQIKAKGRSLLLHKASSFTRISEDSELCSNITYASHKRKLSWFVADVGLYVVQIILGYMIMLVVMTYNAYIAVSVLFGASVGYAVFGALLMKHRIRNTKLTVPCQHCISSPREDSQSTIVEDEAGCCSTSYEQNEELPPIVHASPSADKQSCHAKTADEKSLLSPD